MKLFKYVVLLSLLFVGAMHYNHSFRNFVTNESATVMTHAKSQLSNPNQPTGKTMTINYGQPTAPWEREDNGDLDVEPLHPGHVLYYKLKLAQSDPYYSVWQKAVHNWNALGVIHLVQVANSYKGYTVNLSGNSNPTLGKQEAKMNEYQNLSVADTTFQAEYDPHHIATFIKANASLTPLVGTYAKADQVDVAEHELGHALGFDHDNKNYNGYYAVMNWEHHKDSKVIPLGTFEKKALQSVYH